MESKRKRKSSKFNALRARFAKKKVVNNQRKNSNHSSRESQQKSKPRYQQPIGRVKRKNKISIQNFQAQPQKLKTSNFLRKNNKPKYNRRIRRVNTKMRNRMKAFQNKEEKPENRRQSKTQREGYQIKHKRSREFKKKLRRPTLKESKGRKSVSPYRKQTNPSQRTTASKSPAKTESSLKAAKRNWTYLRSAFRNQLEKRKKQKKQKMQLERARTPNHQNRKKIQFNTEGNKDSTVAFLKTNMNEEQKEQKQKQYAYSQLQQKKIDKQKELKKQKEVQKQKEQQKQEKIWYYLNEYNQQKGPVNLLEITDFLKAHKLHGESYAWKKGMLQWKKINDVPVLLNLLHEQQRIQEQIQEARKKFLRSSKISKLQDKLNNRTPQRKGTKRFRKKTIRLKIDTEAPQQNKVKRFMSPQYKRRVMKMNFQRDDKRKKTKRFTRKKPRKITYMQTGRHVSPNLLARMNQVDRCLRKPRKEKVKKDVVNYEQDEMDEELLKKVEEQNKLQKRKKKVQILDLSSDSDDSDD